MGKIHVRKCLKCLQKCVKITQYSGPICFNSKYHSLQVRHREIGESTTLDQVKRFNLKLKSCLHDKSGSNNYQSKHVHKFFNGN